jgi:hypothetical protein
MKKSSDYNPLSLMFWASLALLLRLAFSFCGHNYDLDSYVIVSELCVEGKNLYEHTNRYNYGFCWACVLACCRYLSCLFSEFNLQVFHCLIVFVLFMVDFFTSALLFKRYGKNIALCFLFFPTAVLLTGYHSQMDNCAVLLAYCSWIILTDTPKRWQLSAVLLACSLIQKHIFILFPLWLWFYKPLFSYKIKFAYICITYGLFLISFLPFLTSQDAIYNLYKNVLAYDSANGVAVFPYLIKQFLGYNIYQTLLNYNVYKYIFILTILFLGWKIRTQQSNLFYLYIVAIVACSSALANQYLAIPILALAIRKSKLSICFAIVSSLFLIFRSPAHIGILWINSPTLLNSNLQMLFSTLCSLYFCQTLLLTYLYLRITDKQL